MWCGLFTRILDIQQLGAQEFGCYKEEISSAVGAAMTGVNSQNCPSMSKEERQQDSGNLYFQEARGMSG